MDMKSEFKMKRDLMKMQTGNYDSMKESQIIERFSKYANKFLFQNCDPFIKKKHD